MILHFSHKDIDQKKWDECIESCPEASLLHTYDFLNCVCENQWNSIIYQDEQGNYLAVFPLPIKKKLGVFSYVYQAPFIQQLGIFFSNGKTETSIKESMWKIVFEKYRYIHIQMKAHFLSNPKAFEIKEKRNYKLSLNSSYDNLYKNYTSSQKNKLNKFKKITEQYSIIESNADESNDFISKIEFLKQKKIPARYQKLQISVLKFLEKKQAKFYHLKKQNNILALLIVSIDNRFITNLYNVSSEEGYKISAMTVLIDNCIKEFAGSNKIFDFEGSMIESVAKFFENFSPEEEKYLEIKYSSFL